MNKIDASIELWFEIHSHKALNKLQCVHCTVQYSDMCAKTVGKKDNEWCQTLCQKDYIDIDGVAAAGNVQ